MNRLVAGYVYTTLNDEWKSRQEWKNKRNQYNSRKDVWYRQAMLVGSDTKVVLDMCCKITTLLS